jgi:type I restriction enzyme S subunit
MARKVPFRELVRYAIGGGWGTDEPTADSLPVRVIRGTDFAKIASGAFDEIPRRFEVRAKVERRLLQANDIVLEISGGSRTSNQTTGRTLFVTQTILDRFEEPVIPASFCRLVRVRDDVVVPRYAYFVLQEMYNSGRAGLYEHHSTGISNFQFEYFLDQEVVWLPPLPEQRAIAHILGTLDDKIEVNRRMSQTLEAMARALFKAWFVDFEPVRAKMEGRWQRGQSLPGLPAHLYDLFPDRLVDSELGEIPEGWEVKRIGDLAEVFGGSTPRTDRSEYWEGGTHHWVTPKDLSALSVPVLLDTERKITDAGLSQISSGLLPKGTVLLSSRAPIGYLAIAEVPVAVNQGFIAMKPRPGISNLFLLRWASAAQEEIVSHANGSTFLEISKSSFRTIRVVSPSSPIMNAFDRISRPMYRKVVKNERESRTLAALRDALLPKLIRGEIRVKEVERFLKERGL